MLTSISCSHLFVLDQDAALEFYVGVLGLQVHTDADLGFMRWLTVCVPGEPGRQILLEKPGPPAMDDATAERARELLTKGAAGGWLMFTTPDARATYADLQAKGVEFTSEPIEQPYGIDFGLRDPFGNHLRIGQLTAQSQQPSGPSVQSLGQQA
ncbi:MAG: lactoylglutathione lyase-like lyase [Frankiales bacterium]|nr:lactoylglutathione lyase-like lyase [Frankiales bacterium]